MPLRLLLRSLFRRSRVERDLDDELSFHLAMEAAQQAGGGVADAEAKRRARRSLGGYQQVKEACRDALRLGWFDSLARDVRYALRSLRRSPTFTLVALLSLAVGVGANCAAFTWADALLLRPLAVPRPSEVINVGSSAWGAGAIGNVLRASYPEYSDLRDRAKSFGGLLAYSTLSAGLAADRDEVPTLRLGMMASADFFDVLGLRPALGRWFLHAEGEVPGRDAMIILSHRLWQSQFGGDSSVVGRRIYVNGLLYTIIGIAPPDFLGVEQFVQTDFYVPLMMWEQLLPARGVHPLEARELRDLTVKGRLKPGVDLDSARAELTVIARDLARAHPDTNSNRDFVVRTELQVRAAQIPLIGMLAALLATLAAAVLFVACANTAGLLASRSPARAREMAVRSAIGAGRTGLVRQLMTESLLLAIGGGVLGVAVGYASMRVFRHVQIPTDLPIGPVFDLNRRALTFSLIVACGSALLFGLVPAIQTSRVDLTAVMKGADDTRGRRSWGRGALVIGQVAVSVVLLVIATFSYRAFRKELTSGPGYRLDHLLMLSVDTGLVRYSDSDSSRFFERLVERARSAPGVRSAALTSAVPMQTTQVNVTTLVPEGFAPRAGQEHISVMSAVVGEQYFSTIRIPIVLGREFQVEDSAHAPLVAIVNELFAEHHWTGRNPLGQRLRIQHAAQADSLVHVVGVAKTSKYMLLAEPPTEYVYFPARQNPSANLILLAQSEGDPASLATPLRNVVRSLDSHMPVYDVRTMQDFYDISTVGLMDTILGTIAAMGTMGLALSLVGLYGLVAYAASRRTKEIGIRMALGADRFAVLRMVMRQGIMLSTAGLAVGLVASIAAGELLAATFVGPRADNNRDFTSLLLVAACVLAVTGLAAYIPARHASRTDPLDALRYE